MSRRLRDLLLLAALGLIVNGAVALLVRSPGYMDAFYYFNAGEALAAGRAHLPELLEATIWNYVGAPSGLPAPGFAYWQPLPSLLAALGIAVFGQGAAFGAAQAVFVLLAGLLPPLAYLVARMGGERRHALLAGTLAAFSGIYVVYWSLPESFTPFALSAGGALALAGLGRRHWRWWMWLLAGVCAGLAHLARADGMLVAGIVALVTVLPARDPALPVSRRLALAGLALVGYGLVMGPWLARNMAVFGSLQAPGGLGTLWLVEYNDLFNYPPNLTAEWFFAAGWEPVLAARWQALKGNLATFVGVHCLVFLTPLTLAGWARRWRNDWLLPATLYGLVLFGAMTFVFALPGLRGGWLHSGAALVPFVMATASLGLEDAVRWIAKRRQTWNPAEAWRVFGVASAVLACVITVGMVLVRVVGLADLSTVAWNHSTAVYETVGAKLDALGVAPDAVVMSNNPPAFYSHTGRGGIPLVNGGEDSLLRAADDYGADFLVLDRNVPAGLWALYEDGPRSSRLALVEAYGESENLVYLYLILPGSGRPGDCCR